MTAADERSRGNPVHAWVQSIGIILAAAWGAYTFVYKEISLPRSAPVNISLNLQLEKVVTSASSTSSPTRDMIPVEMTVAATNPSAREVKLLPSAWIAYGYEVSPKGNPEFQKHTDGLLKAPTTSFVERHSSRASSSVVALGGLFPDTSLKPHETTTRKLIFHVPRNRFELLEVVVVMPTVAREGVILEWQFANSRLEPFMYRVDKTGQRTPMEKDEGGGYVDPRHELQMASSSSALSLLE